MDRRTRRIAAAISELPISDARILDVGSGNGMLAKTLMQLRPDLYIEGIDILDWPDQLIWTRKFDGETIPNNVGDWDYCLVSDVLHHCELPSRLLSEALRVSSKGVIIKDHVADTFLDRVVLSFMDWFGNRGYGVRLPYNYWSWIQWNVEFARNNSPPTFTMRSLGLYPFPLGLIFDRRLHFLCLLGKR
jgi:SAM-dependent methyltransferase